MLANFSVAYNFEGNYFRWASIIIHIGKPKKQQRNATEKQNEQERNATRVHGYSMCCVYNVVM